MIYSLSAEWEESANSVRHQSLSPDLKILALFPLLIPISGHPLFSSETGSEEGSVVRGITKGQAVTYTLSDGKKIQKVTEVVTGTESVVRAVSFLHR